MSSPYIPAKQVDLDAFANNFQSLIAATPGVFGLVTADATAITAAYNSWHSAFTAAISPATRTPDTVQAKIDAQVNLLGVIRPYAQTIANNAAVSSPNKVALGLNPRTNPPTRVPVPVTNPNLTIQQAGVLTHVLRYRDSAAAPTVKAKPAGSVALQLYCKVSATPITDQDTLSYVGNFTKSPLIHSFASADAGKQAYYAGRWINRKGEAGPWSAITAMTVANG